MDIQNTPNPDAGPAPQVAVVLGITGSIGGAIAAALWRRGFRIRALSRAPRRADAFPFPVEWIRGDAVNRADVVRSAIGADILVHAVNPPGYRQWREVAIPMLANSIEAAAAHSATILFPANVYVFSPESGAVVDEDSTKAPRTGKGQVRVEMEQMLEHAASTRGVRSIALRAGDVFGPGVSRSWFAQCVAKGGMTARVLQDLSRPGVGHAWAFVPDLAEAFGRLVDRRGTLQPYEMLHFGGHWIDPGRALCEAARTVIGRADVTIRPFPWFTVYLGAPFKSFLREVIEMMWLWRHPLRLDNTRLERLIGPEPHTPLVDAVRSALDGRPACAAPWPAQPVPETIAA
ncbi:MAG: NAD-dependent epimerase/dehydratase family protein [Hyphomicrobiales bacterium]|nr:NAD-dependent epimerase/dehydratase family protein [Hyphomicrobiales bacterium]